MRPRYRREWGRLLGAGQSRVQTSGHSAKIGGVLKNLKTTSFVAPKGWSSAQKAGAPRGIIDPSKILQIQVAWPRFVRNQVSWSTFENSTRYSGLHPGFTEEKASRRVGTRSPSTRPARRAPTSYRPFLPQHEAASRHSSRQRRRPPCSPDRVRPNLRAQRSCQLVGADVHADMVLALVVYLRDALRRSREISGRALRGTTVHARSGLGVWQEARSRHWTTWGLQLLGRSRHTNPPRPRARSRSPSPSLSRSPSP